jgi:hypothetical protein
MILCKILFQNYDNEYDMENENEYEEEIFDNEYYNQLLDDLSINILFKFKKYLDVQGLNMCRKLSSLKLLDLLNTQF